MFRIISLRKETFLHTIAIFFNSSLGFYKHRIKKKTYVTQDLYSIFISCLIHDWESVIKQIDFLRLIYCCVSQDDPLSALDVHVGAHLFEHGISKILRKHNQTVILVTHQLQYLPEADQVGIEI